MSEDSVNYEASKLDSASQEIVTPYDLDFLAAMEAFAITRKKYRNALRELAK